jgi:hypothetical protein
MDFIERLFGVSPDGGDGSTELIPLPDQNDFAMYGKDVMDLTIFGLRSI